MYKISKLNKIAKEGLELLDSNYEVRDNIKNADALLVRSYKLPETEIDNSIKCIARAGAGVNNIPVSYCSENGIVVFNTPGANANGVKEIVLAGMLLASRDISGSISYAKTIKDEGDNIPKLVEANKSKFKGPEIMGKTLGVIGLGAIGMMVANSASALGMNVIGYDPYLSVDGALKISRKIKKVDAIEKLYEMCDYISIHVPLIDSTKNMICSKTISNMKNGVKILNFARGGLVNDDDILKAIKETKVSTYVTDFPNAKLIDKENIICIPHLGASTFESEINCAIMAVNQTVDYLENGNIVNSVNMPSVKIGNVLEKRICIIYKETKDILKQITDALTKNNISINEMASKTKKEYGYMLIDIKSISEKVISEIESIDEVLNIRVI